MLRVLLAALVIIAHSSLLVTGKAGDTLLDRLTNLQISLGPLCVQGFFILSGYLIAMS